MIIEIDINQFKSKIYDIDFFKDYMKICVRKIHPLLKCRVTIGAINVINVPILYVDFINRTLITILDSEHFWKDYQSYIYKSSLNNKNFKLIDLLFDMFNIKPNDQLNLLQTINNVQIGYDEELHFFTKTPLPNKDRLVETHIANNAYFYKIQHNSDVHTNSSIKIFKNLNVNDYMIINKPSEMYSFQIILDKDLDSYAQLLYVYEKNEIMKRSKQILDDYNKFSVEVKLITSLNENDNLSSN